MTEEQKRRAILYHGLFTEEIQSFENLKEEAQKKLIKKANERITTFEDEEQALAEEMGGEFLAYLYGEEVDTITEEDIRQVEQERLQYLREARKFFENPKAEEYFLKYGILRTTDSGTFDTNNENISAIIENEGFSVNLLENTDIRRNTLDLWNNRKEIPSEKELEEESKKKNGIAFKEFLFCEQYLKTGKMTLTADTLGIGRTTCYEYLKKKEVQEYLEKRREEIKKESDSLLKTGFFDCFEELHNIIKQECCSDSEKIKAIDCYLRHYEQAIYKGTPQQSEVRISVDKEFESFGS